MDQKKVYATELMEVLLRIKKLNVHHMCRKYLRSEDEIILAASSHFMDLPRVLSFRFPERVPSCVNLVSIR